METWTLEWRGGGCDADCAGRLVVEERRDRQLEGKNGALPSFAFADLAMADFVARDLVGADFHGADLAGADMAGALAQGSNLAFADLSWASLVECDLRGADLSNAILRHARLDGADLRGARLEGTDFFGASLVGAKLDESSSDKAWQAKLRSESGEEPGADNRRGENVAIVRNEGGEPCQFGN